MQNLHLLTQADFGLYFSNGFNSYLLNVFTLFAIIFGIFVIITKNTVLSVRAPIWISFARKYSKLVNSFVFIFQGTFKHAYAKLIVILLSWRKSLSLPTFERCGGQQHADKWSPWSRDTFPMARFLYRTGDKNNPFGWFNATDLYNLAVRRTGTSNGSTYTEPLTETTTEPKGNNDKRESNSGLPKFGDEYGNGGSILDCSRMQAAIEGRQSEISKVSIPESTLMGAGDLMTLEELFFLLKTGKISEYKLMTYPLLYKLAYHKIKSNPGNLSPGSDDITFDGISNNWVENTVRSIKDQSFQFKPVRRLFIKKPNGKMRPLGIPCPRDKIVQEVMRMILEVIYEPLFLDSSHGFRPFRSCKTALKSISKWNTITWAIEGDIKGFFDNVNHDTLYLLLSKQIKDKRFLDLFRKLVNAGYVESDTLKHNSLGVPQGGLISPILSNIYLHELDKYIAELIKEFSTPLVSRNTKVSQAYIQISWNIRKLCEAIKFAPCNKRQILTEINKLRNIRDLMPSRVWVGSSIHYCRYADDWIVGITGSRDLAINLKSKIKQFLADRLELELSEEKTKVTHLKSEKASFLGTFITLGRTSISKFGMKNYRSRMEITRSCQETLKFYAPIQKIVQKLEQNGFIKRAKNDQTKFIPSAQTKWTKYDHRSIVIRYNEIIKGYTNYYSFVDNFAQLAGYLVNHFLVHSCAKTLALKFKLKSRKAVFSKYGPLLSPIEVLQTSHENFNQKKLNNIEISIQKRFHKKREFIVAEVKDPLSVLNWGLKTSNDLLEHPCWVCGEKKGVQIHHLRHIRRMNEKLSGFSSVMEKLNRKQIPVCLLCHAKIHKGEYDAMSPKDLHRVTNYKQCDVPGCTLVSKYKH